MEIKRILVTGRLQEELKHRLDGVIGAELRCLPEDRVTEQDLAWADAYAGFRPVPGFLPEQYRWVHALGAGVDAFIHRKPWSEQTILTRTTGDFGRKIAEYCLGHMLADAQHHEGFSEDQRARRWGPQAAVPLAGQAVAVFGTGTIGQTISLTLRALGVRAYGISWSGTAHEAFDKTVSLREAAVVLDQADWVINTLPLTEQTEALFDERLIALMKPGCAFINVGRGGSLVEPDLLRALDRGQLRKAVLDVLSVEPLPDTSPLWSRPDIKITPHIAAVTDAEEAAQALLDTWNALQQGENLLANRVNIERGY
ncbi:D-2-hydroxyacid dehydrogenase [Paenibacillus filicis]|uniref:D-2-hydroxyacid dehydrogenase n=1 Tax=Paenibacillus filicis TaxID=669464 RepID=A0ABU9DHS2_9BACL